MIRVMRCRSVDKKALSGFPCRVSTSSAAGGPGCCTIAAVAEAWGEAGSRQESALATVAEPRPPSGKGWVWA